MVWYPRHKPKLKENFTGAVYAFIQSTIKRLGLCHTFVPFDWTVKKNYDWFRSRVCHN